MFLHKVYNLYIHRKKNIVKFTTCVFVWGNDFFRIHDTKRKRLYMVVSNQHQNQYLMYCLKCYGYGLGHSHFAPRGGSTFPFCPALLAKYPLWLR